MSTTVIIILGIYILGVIGMLDYTFPGFQECFSITDNEYSGSRLEGLLILSIITLFWPITLIVGIAIIFIKTFNK